MRGAPGWLAFTVLRLAFFAVPFGLLMLSGALEPWVAALIAAVIGLCLSFIFLDRQRRSLVDGIRRRRETPSHADEDAEDAELGGAAVAPRGERSEEERGAES